MTSLAIPKIEPGAGLESGRAAVAFAAAPAQSRIDGRHSLLRR